MLPGVTPLIQQSMAPIKVGLTSASLHHIQQLRSLLIHLGHPAFSYNLGYNRYQLGYLSGVAGDVALGLLLANGNVVVQRLGLEAGLLSDTG